MNLDEVLFEEELHSITSIYTPGDFYRYRISLDLKRRFQYELEMIIENNNNSAQLNFSISELIMKETSSLKLLSCA